METNNSSSPYAEGRVYKATIIDQLLTHSYNDELQLILTIKILARLKNDKNPATGVEECPQEEREVRVTFVGDDDNRLRMALRDLERLGFPKDEQDLSRLHPDHPQSVSLTGKEVHVRPKISNDNEYWNFVWPKAVALELSETEAAAETLKAKIARIKKKEDSPTTKKKETKDEKQTEVGY